MQMLDWRLMLRKVGKPQSQCYKAIRLSGQNLEWPVVLGNAPAVI